MPEDDKERLLSIVGNLQPEKQVGIAVDIMLPGQRKNIVHGALFLQDNLVKSEYGFSKENFNVNPLKNHLNNLKTRIKELGDKNSVEFKRVIDRIQPTFKRLEQSYMEDLKKIVHEVTNDETLKEISDFEKLWPGPTLSKVESKLVDEHVKRKRSPKFKRFFKK